MPLLATYILPHPPIIIPEVGRGEEKHCEKTRRAMEEVAQAIAAHEPDTIIMTSPHMTAYSDYFHIAAGKHAHGSFEQFGAPDVTFEVGYDQSLIEAIESRFASSAIPGGTRGAQDSSLDHGTTVPLYFIEKAAGDFKLVRIGLSGLSFKDHYDAGAAIGAVAEASEKKIVLVASGDLSHCLKEEGPYGYKEEGPLFDEKLINILKTAEFGDLIGFDSGLADAANECGLRSFLMMAGALDNKAVETTFHSYEAPFGVGYAVLSYAVKKKDDTRAFRDEYENDERRRIEAVRGKESAPVRLARHALETYVLERKGVQPTDEITGFLRDTAAGAFVSLKKHKTLRGCIGTVEPGEENLASEIITNAVGAGADDPRFPPVKAFELPFMEYTVDVIGRAEPIDDIRSLDPVVYGVAVEKDDRRGVLLPRLEGIDSPEKQLDIVLKKAGIDPSESYLLSRFEVTRYH